MHISAQGRELTGRVNRLLEGLEADIRKRVRSSDVKGFHEVMRAVEEITRVRLRER